jgi:hypothetical protein
MPPGNKSIRDFFKPSQPAPKPANLPGSLSRSSSKAAPSRSTTKPSISPNPAISRLAMGQAKSSVSTDSDQPKLSVVPDAPDHPKPCVNPSASDQRGYASSLSPPPAGGEFLRPGSPPPASEPSSSTLSGSPANDPTPPAGKQSPRLASPSQKGHVPFHSVTINTSSDRVIQNSDGEDEDSDSSLEDLSALLAAKSSEVRAKQAISGITPSTPPKYSASNVNFHFSPLPVLSKYKFDLQSLVSRTEDLEAIEASSKRVKAMLASKDEDEDKDTAMSDHAAELANFPHGALLGSVVADREDLEAHKVTRAIMRTEATTTEKRWYFFDTMSSTPKPKRTSFPSKAVPEKWKRALDDPKTRYQTFISGFAENMVALGMRLPDELFLWVLDEACLEASDLLRASYVATLRESTEQIKRLLSPDLVVKVFQRLGGSSTGTEITQKIVPITKLVHPYSNRDWTKLLLIVNFFGQISRPLQQKSRTTVICMLLRMSVDHVVYENVDLLDSIQGTISRLCKYTPNEDWEACVRNCSLLPSKQLIVQSVKRSANRYLSALVNRLFV